MVLSLQFKSRAVQRIYDLVVQLFYGRFCIILNFLALVVVQVRFRYFYYVLYLLCLWHIILRVVLVRLVGISNRLEVLNLLLTLGQFGSALR